MILEIINKCENIDFVAFVMVYFDSCAGRFVASERIFDSRAMALLIICE